MFSAFFILYFVVCFFVLLACLKKNHAPKRDSVTEQEQEDRDESKALESWHPTPRTDIAHVEREKDFVLTPEDDDSRLYARWSEFKGDYTLFNSHIDLSLEFYRTAARDFMPIKCFLEKQLHARSILWDDEEYWRSVQNRLDRQEAEAERFLLEAEQSYDAIHRDRREFIRRDDYHARRGVGKPRHKDHHRSYLRSAKRCISDESCSESYKPFTLITKSGIKFRFRKSSEMKLSRARDMY